MNRLGRALILVCAWALAGCNSIDGELPAPVARSGTGVLHAGAAQVDITPDLGRPLGGHSLEGDVGYGVWTHLYARAVYLEDEDGTPVVLVACDLWAVAAGLPDRVASELARDPKTAHIGRAHLFIGGTHTHHSPGNFTSSRIYNQHATNSPGFDPRLLEFLTQRIVGAIGEAVDGAQPAHLTRGQALVPALARNRSIEPFLQNAEALSFIESHTGSRCPEHTHAGVDLCRAVDPMARTLSVRNADDDGLIAVVGLFAVHATSMLNKTPMVNADLHGVASARLAAALAHEGRRPVVALFNGPEGDVSPNWDAQGPAAATRLGRRLGDGLAKAVGGRQTPVTGPFIVNYGVVPIADARGKDAAGQDVATSHRAMSGRSQLAGAEDGRTIFYKKLGWREGMIADTEVVRGQGLKLPAVPRALLFLGLPEQAVPRTLPLSVARLGDVTLASLPGEFTTMMGQRIRARLRAGLQLPDDAPVWLAGLTNEYLGYYTTPEEYDLQHYEGASMAYGRQAGTLVAHHLVQVAKGETSVPTAYHHRPGRMRHFGMARDRMARMHIEDARARAAEIFPATNIATFSFEAPPGVPHARLETLAGERFGEEHTLLEVLAVSADSWRYRVRVLAPAGEALPPGGELRVVVTLPGGEQICSAPLSGAEPVAAAPCPSA